MKNKEMPTVHAAHNIIPLHLNAEFYFQRGMQSLDRYHYEKALRYFRRAVESEPDNAVHHINLAGVLSETGDFAASNQILQYVLESLDPNLTECHFYMANNYLNMDLLEESERSLLLYLELDEQGLYLDEAEEMLELLSFELGRPIKVKTIRSRAALFEHEQARQLLEEGRFNEAVAKLESLVDRFPDFLAAYNNLALAYYYRGQLDLALATVEKVLEEEPENLHALCNLAILKLQLGQILEVQALLNMLRKLYPLNPEHSFKLATTMGILGEHEHAYRLFRMLLKMVHTEYDPSLYHYTAVAAVHTNRLSEARSLWKQVKKLDPGEHVADYYLQRLDEYEEGACDLQTFSYSYHLPFEEQFKWIETADESLSEQLRHDPIVRSSFFWVLRYGDHDMKLQVIQALGMIGDQEVELALREFIQRPEEAEDLKLAALHVLQSLRSEEVRQDGTAAHEVLNLHGTTLPVWEQSWQDVLEIALQQMEHRYDLIERYDMQTLWTDFLSRTYPGTPQIRRPEGWSAALEYLIAKMHRRQVTYMEVAARYGISESTVRRNAARIDEACGLREKMEAIFPHFGGKL